MYRSGINQLSCHVLNSLHSEVWLHCGAEIWQWYQTSMKHSNVFTLFRVITSHFTPVIFVIFRDTSYKLQHASRYSKTCSANFLDFRRNLRKLWYLEFHVDYLPKPAHFFDVSRFAWNVLEMRWNYVKKACRAASEVQVYYGLGPLGRHPRKVVAFLSRRFPIRGIVMVRVRGKYPAGITGPGDGGLVP